jgi:hypothetical protein
LQLQQSFPFFSFFFSFAEVQKALKFVRAKVGDRCRFEDATESGIMGDTYQETEELLDYEEEEDAAPNGVGAKAAGDAVKKGYVGIHSSGFRDFLLKPELLRAIVDCGFEHPSEGFNSQTF